MRLHTRSHVLTTRLLPAWLIVLLDLAVIGAVFYVFSLFHHILPRYGTAKLQIVSSAASSIQTQTPSPAGTEITRLDGAQAAIEESTAVRSSNDGNAALPPVQLIGEDFEAFPTYDTGVGASLSYQSDSLRVAVRHMKTDDSHYFVADVWVRNIGLLRTAFAQNQYGTGIHQGVQTMSRNNGAQLAINGDYFGARAKGLVIRNGVLYRDKLFEDVCVLYENGVMETMSVGEVSIPELVEKKAYQAWSFGPELLENGEPISRFDSAIARENPRTAVGYYEPGHYVFVAVDGRQSGYSRGMTLAELSQLFYDLGCTVAYNLDGGQSTVMTFGGDLVNQPYNDGRPSSDIVYVIDGGGRS